MLYSLSLDKIFSIRQKKLYLCMSISHRKNANQSAHGVVLQGETRLSTGVEGALSLFTVLD